MDESAGLSVEANCLMAAGASTRAWARIASACCWVTPGLVLPRTTIMGSQGSAGSMCSTIGL